MGKKIKVDELPGEIIYRYRLCNGLTTLNSDLNDDKKILMVYFDMRPFEEFDKAKKNPVLKDLLEIDDETIRIFYKDMCDAIHVDETISFRTKMSVKAAKFVLIALAHAVLDRDTVKSVVKNCGVNFHKYGEILSLEEFVAEEKPIIKLRAKERKLLDKFKRACGDERRGLETYVRLNRKLFEYLTEEFGCEVAINKYAEIRYEDLKAVERYPKASKKLLQSLRNRYDWLP